MVLVAAFSVSRWSFKMIGRSVKRASALSSDFVSFGFGPSHVFVVRNVAVGMTRCFTLLHLGTNVAGCFYVRLRFGAHIVWSRCATRRRLFDFAFICIWASYYEHLLWQFWLMLGAQAPGLCVWRRP